MVYLQYKEHSTRYRLHGSRHVHAACQSAIPPFLQGTKASCHPKGRLCCLSFTHWSPLCLSNAFSKISLAQLRACLHWHKEDTKNNPAMEGKTLGCKPALRPTPRAPRREDDFSCSSTGSYVAMPQAVLGSKPGNSYPFLAGD